MAYPSNAAPATTAPFGAFVVSRLPRTPTLLIVSALCVSQFLWTVLEEKVAGTDLLWAIAGVLAMNIVFDLMFRHGEVLRRLRALAGSQPGFKHGV